MSSPLTPDGPNKLTSHPPGSMRELWKISFPLMLSLMSVSLMLFLDRLFLSRYSLDALNASANGGVLVQFMQFWCISTVSIAEVFVGRYNGARKIEKLGQPVWQMIWLSLASVFWFVPLGLWAGPYFFHEDAHYLLEIDYFKYLMCFGPMAALSGALSAFYIGQGQVKFVTCVMGISNLINIGLDMVFIFGWEPIVPSMGIKGAALATGIAQTSQALILGCNFLNARNRKEKGTGRWHFNKRLFRKSLSIGLPNAVAHTLELMAWVIIFHLMTKLGSDYITVVTVAQSIFFLFTFMTEGVSKGATAIAANFFGSQQQDLVWKLLKSGLKLYLFVFLFLGLILVWNPDPLIRLFLAHDMVLSPATQSTLHAACFWVWLFFLFDGINWLLIGLLTAAGDTRFIMKVGGAGPWLVALLPIYLFVFKWGAPANITWMLIAFYGMASSAIYLWRFKSEKWKEVALA
ncbi:putative multidrug efflux protein [Candidatus Protochlamydia naegleriophila]|uniref:Multidrug-efflux transporter n=1 Tax=Candidatus Protochlamydia naegleriophila TaxID=389348 RepID=A0A0U5JCV9_9BACT|nr:MATE family efflux transporter [Candidatus Protochlamydia naegleriophila]CUI16666.1 putative multidrug efflux protein [Candidatus Protochlamydia naegleriophila]